MHPVTPEMIEQAGQMDLLTYLRCFEPEELVHFSGDTYTTKTHDSLKISNGKWMWWSRGIGGYTALDYLVKVKEMDFIRAVRMLNGRTAPVSMPPLKPAPEKPKVLLLPERSDTTKRVTAYLSGRGIDPVIIRDCIRKGLIFESLPYHNVVFVGRDQEGKPRYAAYRATNASRIMGDVSGSDKHFAFRLEGEEGNTLHLFESAIDALSYATLLKTECQNWHDSTLLSLAGVYAPRRSLEDGKLPAALEQYLQEHPHPQEICLHLDNDRAGRQASAVLDHKLAGICAVRDEPPPSGKDFNDFLCSRLKIRRETERNTER